MRLQRRLCGICFLHSWFFISVLYYLVNHQTYQLNAETIVDNTAVEEGHLSHYIKPTLLPQLRVILNQP